MRVEVLAPDHMGFALANPPTFYWYVNRRFDGQRVELTLTRDDHDDPVAEKTLKGTVAAGVHAWTPAPKGRRLEPGVPHFWSVSLVYDSKNRSKDLFASGSVTVEAPPSRHVSTGSLEDQAAQYAEAGYWYDAVAAVEKAWRRSGAKGALQRLRKDLYGQVGLDIGG